ncbi:MAG: 4-hydroxy-3-methylbut-2-enyl diphosphate reductase [Lentisphaerae bacterium]|jgi:4-hydroxy-3-methylbut-2-enyl diphosphate reductase|nr:4-hydroxy-3-methylbut-2-enyl diphosphate reductase [Lentisphaerota bacterium]
MKNRKVVIANPHGFCAGVRHAVEIAGVALQRTAEPLYALNEIVHNREVVESFRSRGITFVRDLSEVPSGRTVLFSAHGVSPTIRAAAAERQLKVIDATCPFVTKVHKEVIRYATQGYSIVLIGHKGHDEVVGIAGEAPDHVTVVENCADARVFTPRNRQHVAVVTQTTLSAAEAGAVIEVLRQRFPGLEAPQTSDICYATTNRQEAVRLVAARVGDILVLGAANSSNTRRLVEVANAAGARGHLVSELGDIEQIELEGIEAIGLTAGASTPQTFVKRVLLRLAEKGFEEIEEVESAHENITFPLPAGLR